MNKHIFILNGMGGCGKDTFAGFLLDIVPTFHYSSVYKIKEIAEACGWDGGKTEKDRKFLSDLKLLTTEYNDLPFKDISEEVEFFRNTTIYFKVLLIDIREPAEIERAKKAFGAKTILIKNDRVPHIHSNMADNGVFDYDYDIVIENNGTLEDFRETVKKFAEEWLV
jgi:dephospho-CoA kinase